MKYQANSSFIMKEIADEKILVPRGETALDYGAMVVLNGTGIVIWEDITEPKTFTEIVKTVTEKYGVSFEQVAEDVTAFLTRAVAEGFITVAEE